MSIGVGDFVCRKDDVRHYIVREVVAVDGKTVLVKGTVHYPSRSWWSTDSCLVLRKAWRIQQDRERQARREKEGWMFWLGAEGEYSTYINNLPRAVANRAVQF